MNIFYHYAPGQITAKEEQYDRADLVGKARTEDGMNDKEMVEDALQQKHKTIHEMEIYCTS